MKKNNTLTMILLGICAFLLLACGCLYGDEDEAEEVQTIEYENNWTDGYQKALMQLDHEWLEVFVGCDEYGVEICYDAAEKEAFGYYLDPEEGVIVAGVNPEVEFSDIDRDGTSEMFLNFGDGFLAFKLTDMGWERLPESDGYDEFKTEVYYQNGNAVKLGPWKYEDRMEYLEFMEDGSCISYVYYEDINTTVTLLEEGSGAYYDFKNGKLRVLNSDGSVYMTYEVNNENMTDSNGDKLVYIGVD